MRFLNAQQRLERKRRRVRAWKKRNKERVRFHQRMYMRRRRSEDRERFKALDRAWYQRNKRRPEFIEKRRKRLKAWKERNKERVRLYQREYMKGGYMKEYMKRYVKPSNGKPGVVGYYKSNRDRLVEYQREWRLKNPARARFNDYLYRAKNKGKTRETRSLCEVFGTSTLSVEVKKSWAMHQLGKRVLDGKIHRNKMAEKIVAINEGKTFEAYE